MALKMKVKPRFQTGTVSYYVLLKTGSLYKAKFSRDLISLVAMVYMSHYTMLKKSKH